MTNKLYDPAIPTPSVTNKAEPDTNTKAPKRPVSGYGPSLGSKTQSEQNR